MRSIADWNVVLDRITQSLNESLDKVKIPPVVVETEPPAPGALQVLDDRLGGLQQQLDLAQKLADEGDRNGAERVKSIQEWLDLLHQNKERLLQALQEGLHSPGIPNLPG
jgi:hypothetical protein